MTFEAGDIGDPDAVNALAVSHSTIFGAAIANAIH
jgi:hypothetical protein